MAESYEVLGMMSGSSLDGLDLAFCRFELKEDGKWNYTILEAETIPYPPLWQNELVNLPFSKSEELIEKDIAYGKYLGEISRSFLRRKNTTADLIASHGHTIFHNPKKSFTFQLGNGQALATASGLTTVYDFRTKDISLGGQGAPLVPIGDELLFADYDICLNLGGIANISYKKDGKRVAHDVCPANQLLNFLSKQKELDFDRGGELARSGSVNKKLQTLLVQDKYYSTSAPKSLSNQYVQKSFIEIIDSFDDTIENKLRTCNEHIVQQIHQDTETLPKGTLLATGGGAHNSYLVHRLSEISKHEIIVPDRILVDFKEALVFAFMGVLRYRNEINCLASVTGATADSSVGVISNA